MEKKFGRVFEDSCETGEMRAGTEPRESKKIKTWISLLKRKKKKKL